MKTIQHNFITRNILNINILQFMISAARPAIHLQYKHCSSRKSICNHITLLQPIVYRLYLRSSSVLRLQRKLTVEQLLSYLFVLAS